jgi:hypothetical protein
VDVVGQILGPSDSEGNRLVAIQVRVVGVGLPVELVARGLIGVEGGSDEGGADAQIVGWSTEEPELNPGALPDDDVTAFTSSTETCWVIARTKVDLAVDVQIDVVA